MISAAIMEATRRGGLWQPSVSAGSLVRWATERDLIVATGRNLWGSQGRTGGENGCRTE